MKVLYHRRRIRYSIHEPCTLARMHGSVRGRGGFPPPTRSRWCVGKPSFARGKHDFVVGKPDCVRGKPGFTVG